MNILLVEDHQLTRLGIKMVLGCYQDDFKIIAEADTVQKAKDIVSSSLPIDLILLDIGLPDGTGTEVAQYAQLRRPDIKILVISMEAEAEVILKVLKLGATGFISKYSSPEIMVDAIRSVADGVSYLGRDIAQIINAVKVAKSCEDKVFTGRELDIVRLCAQGYSAKQIATELNISMRTVETHKNNIFKKMGFGATTELVHYALENGIVRF